MISMTLCVVSTSVELQNSPREVLHKQGTTSARSELKKTFACISPSRERKQFHLRIAASASQQTAVHHNDGKLCRDSSLFKSFSMKRLMR